MKLGQVIVMIYNDNFISHYQGYERHAITLASRNIMFILCPYDCF